MPRGAPPRLPTGYRSGAMFYWNAWDGVLTPRTLQTPTFLRPSGALFIDSEGNLARVADDQPRWYQHLESGLFGLLLETIGSTNSCLWSEDFANWTAVNSPSQVANAIRLGLLKLSLLIDDSGVNQEYYQRTDVNISVTTAGVSCFMKQGTSPAAAGSQILLIDSGAATRLDATITWTNGVPTIVMATGTFVGKVQCRNGVYRLLFTSTTTAAGNATIRIIPAKTANQQGNVYVGGVDVESNRPIPSQYISTVGVTATRAAETLLWSMLAQIRDLTMYGKCVDLGSGSAGSMFIRIGDEATVPWMRIASATIGPSTSASWDSGTGPIGASVAAGSSFGQAFEHRGSLDLAGLLTVGYATLGGAESVATQQAVVPPVNTPWGVSQVRVGQGGGDSILLNQIAVYPTVLTMDQLRKRG